MVTINVVTGPGHGCSTTIQGLPDLFETNDLSVYPNPSAGNFEIRLDEVPDGIRMVLFNTFGQAIYAQDLEKGKNSINCASLPKGIYSLSVLQGNSRLGSRRLVIE
jgi:hypothetical protein